MPACLYGWGCADAVMKPILLERQVHWPPRDSVRGRNPARKKDTEIDDAQACRILGQQLSQQGQAGALREGRRVRRATELGLEGRRDPVLQPARQGAFPEDRPGIAVRVA